jgi:hypothetical protein
VAKAAKELAPGDQKKYSSQRRDVNRHARKLRQSDHAARLAGDELLALGKQLACLQPELVSMSRWFDDLQELVAAEVSCRGIWPEDTSEWTWRDAAAYCAVRECVERETDIGTAYIRAKNALEACYIRIDPICAATLSFKARTRGGRAVKKMASAIRTGQWRD